MKTAGFALNGLFLATFALSGLFFQTPARAASSECAKVFEVELFANKLEPGSLLKRALNEAKVADINDLPADHPARELSRQLQQIVPDAEPAKIKVVSRDNFSFLGTAQIVRIGIDSKTEKPIHSLVINIDQLSLKDWARAEIPKDASRWDKTFGRLFSWMSFPFKGVNNGQFEKTDEVAKQFTTVMTGLMHGLGELYIANPSLTRLDVKAKSLIPYSAISNLLAEFNFTRQSRIFKRPAWYAVGLIGGALLYVFPHLSQPGAILLETLIATRGLLGGRTWQLSMDFNPQWRDANAKATETDIALEAAESLRGKGVDIN